MTNEELAKAEAIKILDWVHGDKTASPNFITDTITRLLDEKDKGFKEYLEKKRKKYLVLQEQEYQETKHYQSSLYYAFLNKANAIDEIINELFKEDWL